MNINKKKLRKILYIYMAAIVLLIFSSKTIYNITLPKVSVAIPESGGLTKELEARGSISFAETFDIYAAESGQINEIFIEKGDIVTPDTVIITYTEQGGATAADDTSLDFNIERINNQLAALALNKAAIQAKLRELGAKPDDLYAHQCAVDDARTALDRRQNELDAMWQLMEEHLDDYAYWQAVTMAENAVSDARTALERAEKNLELAEAAMTAQIDETRKTLHLELKKVDLDMERANIDLCEAHAALAALSDSDVRKIHADRSGRVISLEKAKGQYMIQGEKIATVGVNNNVFTTEITCAESDGRFIEIGDEAAITGSDMTKAARAVVTEITPLGDALKIGIVCESAELSGGEYVNVKLQKQTPVYDIIVPNEAIFREGMNNYVWMIRSRQGTLGVEYFTVKVRVIIADTDDFHTAIARGLELAWPPAPVVVECDRSLTANGRVRRMG